MIFSMLLQIFTFKDLKLAENLTNMVDTPKKKHWTPQGSLGLLFSSSRDPWQLVEPGQHQVPRGVVVGIVEGNSRAKALLHPDADIPTGLKWVHINVAVLENNINQRFVLGRSY